MSKTLCTCGHDEIQHAYMGGQCLWIDRDGRDWLTCPCTAFRPVPDSSTVKIQQQCHFLLAGLGEHVRFVNAKAAEIMQLTAAPSGSSQATAAEVEALRWYANATYSLPGYEPDVMRIAALRSLLARLEGKA